MNQLISVIIPVYKVEEYLDECVASVVGQTHRELEIILVDDGSPDTCGAMCDAWAEKDSRIKVIHKSNGGLSDARNAGLEIAGGEYIAFVDSDDWIRPDMYEKLLAALLKEDADLCACNILSCYPDRQVAWGCGEYTVGDSEKILAMLYSDTAYPVSAWNKLYRRKCWDSIRFPVGKICEDAFTTYLLVDKAEKIVQIPDALYCYRIRPGSIMTSAFRKARMDEEEAWRCNYQFVEKHYPRLRKLAFNFYLEKVNMLMGAISKEERQKYMDEHRLLRQILKDNMAYIILFGSLPFKVRLKILLDFLKD